MTINTGGAILQSIRKAHNLSQYEMALQGKTYQANVSSIESGKTDPKISTLESFIAPMGYSIIAIPTTNSSASRIALSVSRALEEGNESRAFRLCIQLGDNLANVHPTLIVALTLEEPVLSGESRFDALIAGICEYRLSALALPIPQWLSHSARKLGTPWIVDKYEANLDEIKARTPLALQSRNVFIAESEFSSI